MNRKVTRITNYQVNEEMCYCHFYVSNKTLCGNLVFTIWHPNSEMRLNLDTEMCKNIIQCMVLKACVLKSPFVYWHNTKFAANITQKCHKKDWFIMSPPCNKHNVLRLHCQCKKNLWNSFFYPAYKAMHTFHTAIMFSWHGSHEYILIL